MHARIFIWIYPIILTLGLTACAGPKFEAEVVRFHNAAVSQQQGRSVTIQPAHQTLEGLEFARYADVIGAKLATYGFRAAGEGQADLTAIVDYGARILPQIDDGRDSPVSVGVGVGGGSRNVGVSVGTIFGVGESKPDERFTRDLMLQLRDNLSGAVVFEGRVTSQGRERDLNTMMPYLVNALFENFPGPNGTTTIYEEDIRP